MFRIVLLVLALLLLLVFLFLAVLLPRRVGPARQATLRSSMVGAHGRAPLLLRKPLDAGATNTLLRLSATTREKFISRPTLCGRPFFDNGGPSRAAAQGRPYS